MTKSQAVTARRLATISSFRKNVLPNLILFLPGMKMGITEETLVKYVDLGVMFNGGLFKVLQKAARNGAPSPIEILEARVPKWMRQHIDRENRKKPAATAAKTGHKATHPS